MEVINIEEIDESNNDIIVIEQEQIHNKRPLELTEEEKAKLDKKERKRLKKLKKKEKEKRKAKSDDLEQDTNDNSIVILDTQNDENQVNNLSEEDLAAYEQIIEDSDIEIIENPSVSKEDLDRVRKEQEIADETPVCIICYGEPTNAVVTECGHVYCCECLHEYRNKNFTTCAVCRKHCNDRNNHLVIMKSILVPKIEQ